MAKRSMPATHVVPDTDAALVEAGERHARVAEAWRVAMAHMQLGEVPLEMLDIADPLPDAPRKDSADPRRSPVAEVSRKHAGEAPRMPAGEDRPPSEDDIDDSVDESFPASDPPSWSRSHA